jgi:hypothetical protein
MTCCTLTMCQVVCPTISERVCYRVCLSVSDWGPGARLVASTACVPSGGVNVRWQCVLQV